MPKIHITSTAKDRVASDVAEHFAPIPAGASEEALDANRAAFNEVRAELDALPPVDCPMGPNGELPMPMVPVTLKCGMLIYFAGVDLLLDMSTPAIIKPAGRILMPARN